jgi:hypothetical protein
MGFAVLLKGTNTSHMMLAYSRANANWTGLSSFLSSAATVSLSIAVNSAAGRSNEGTAGRVLTTVSLR